MPHAVPIVLVVVVTDLERSLQKSAWLLKVKPI